MQRRSRFKTERRAPSIRVTANDLEILALLERYRHLPSSHLLALLARSGKDSSYYKNRLTKLRHDAQLIGCPEASWRAANARYRPAVYELTSKGRNVLRQHGYAVGSGKSGGNFSHELMISLFHASIALGTADDPRLTLITAAEILGHPSCPASTRERSDPFLIPVQIPRTGSYGEAANGLRENIRHDGDPFGVAYAGAGGRIARLFFAGIEADRCTEPLHARDAERSSIARKVRAILSAADDRVYSKHLGIPNCLVPIVTISEVRKSSMMGLVDQMTNGAGSRILLFKSIPDFSGFETFPPPSGQFLTESWDRVGYPQFNIARELARAVEEQ